MECSRSVESAAGGRNHRITDINEHAPRRAAGTALPQIPFVVFHAAAPEEIHVFLLKRPRAVMLLLPGDVLPHGVALRRPHGECTVALLPCKARHPCLCVHPARGGCFDFPHRIREAMRGPQAEEQMHMIGDTTDGFGDAVHLADDSTEVSVQAFAPRCDDERRAILRGKDDMVLQREMGGGHCTFFPSAPSGAHAIFPDDPVVSLATLAPHTGYIPNVPSGRAPPRAFVQHHPAHRDDAALRVATISERAPDHPQPGGLNGM